MKFMIYLAPIQGFTDYVYRKAYANIFSGVDAFFIPYITAPNDKLLKKYEREIRPENNLYGRCVPQLLFRDVQELYFLISVVKDHGYSEANLNLGCPYPMVTNRGRGAALLANPNELRSILDGFFRHFKLKLSVKLRAGLKSPDELKAIIQVLNDYPASEIILHARVAQQLYKGPINDEAFQLAVARSEHPVVYNGDIFSVEAFESRSDKFADVSDWMLGRGILMNAFLPAEIKGKRFTEEEKRTILHEFHDEIVEAYLQTADNEGNAVNKLRQCWIYFSHHFDDQSRVFKKIKKSKSLNDIKREALLLIRDSALKQSC
ncbi:tRNA dihydrouridine synthase [Maribellus mangrovi]|uniref:tRNA dihydrouridine synthase n=1 Tax=Maribellus mangrovi TaxID=3133146 RepID=UPI0030EB8800